MAPPVPGSTPIPGKKWSTVLFAASMGMRTTGVQLCPFVEVLITMSLLEHPARNRQSFQTV